MTGIFWTASAFAALGLIGGLGGVYIAARSGGPDAAGVFITGTVALVVCEAIAIVLAIVGLVTG